jgi:hypothetical protein
LVRAASKDEIILTQKPNTGFMVYINALRQIREIFCLVDMKAALKYYVHVYLRGELKQRWQIS